MELEEKRRKAPDEVTEQEWKDLLTPEQFKITRRAGTEPSFTGEYCDLKEPGTYACVCCLTPLFSSQEKYASGSGWPSYWKPLEGAPVEEREDRSHGMVRTEVVCGRCDAHLGHVFEDGPQPTGLRYCINSAALRFEPQD